MGREMGSGRGSIHPRGKGELVRGAGQVWSRRARRTVAEAMEGAACDGGCEGECDGECDRQCDGVCDGKDPDGGREGKRDADDRDKDDRDGECDGQRDGDCDGGLQVAGATATTESTPTRR